MIHRIGQSADLTYPVALHIGQRGNLQAFWRDDDATPYNTSVDVTAIATGRYVLELLPSAGGALILGAEPALLVVDVLP